VPRKNVSQIPALLNSTKSIQVNKSQSVSPGQNQEDWGLGKVGIMDGTRVEMIGDAGGTEDGGEAEADHNSFSAIPKSQLHNYWKGRMTGNM